jgi:SNF2 family DNA or RNA helicase
MAYSWAYDRFKQALDRVHRMTSAKPVNVYVVLCTGSIDRRLESLVQEKSDAAELVLDGRLVGESTEEVNLAELLKVAGIQWQGSTLN